MRSFADRETHFSIEASGTPPSVDGLAISEPKFLVCCSCGARVEIDGPDGHHTAVDDLPHTTRCDQRDVVSRFYLEQFVE